MEHLHTGKSLTGGQWVVGELFHNPDGNKAYINVRHTRGGKTSSVIVEIRPDSIRAVSELCDGTSWEKLPEEEKLAWLSEHDASEWHGRVLCEGDIIANDWCGAKGLSVVRYGEHKRSNDSGTYPCGDYGFYVQHINDEDYGRSDILFFAKKCIIVGNVYDNRDLVPANM